ncbi:hypothetical protein [Pseudomonas phage Rollin]|nr:hypothetical protein [Pseudomonas phage Rollin]
MNIGDRYGRLVIKSNTRKTRANGSIQAFVCICDCGVEVVIDKYNLRNGHAQSCGCLHRQRTSQAKKMHGKSHTKIYYIWQTMIARCTNPKNGSYERYGARGITVCDRWVESFSNFYADMGDPPPGTTLDRRDNDQGYAPGNCRWATAHQQARNRHAYKSNKLGVNGVCPTKNGTFSVNFRINGRLKTWRVKTLIDAVALRYRLEREYWGSNTP